MDAMDRRSFLGYCAATGIASAFPAPAAGPGEASSPLEGAKPSARVLIADAHAHPYQLHGSRQGDASTPTLGIMEQLGLAVCAHSAVGDMTYYRGHSGAPYNYTQHQLRQVLRLAQSEKVRLIAGASELRSQLAAGTVTGALMAIEGADALEGKLQNLIAFHEQGVRLITIMHDRDNELGFNQRSSADGPLTPFGVQVIERMNQLGMVVDVSHSGPRTLHSIAETSAAPIIDSHTSPMPQGEDRAGLRRLRTWHEMEAIAKTGGLVCTWPFAYSRNGAQRSTLRHWADEIVQMKARLGIAHCGLGTDGGGGLPRLVSGWESIASLPRLMDAMRDAGLTQDDIAACVGGNFLRILERCLAPTG